MKHKLTNFDLTVNNLIVCNLLIKYLDLINESLQKQLLSEQMFFEIDVTKIFAIFKRKHLCCSLFLMKLQALNFRVNIAKCLKTAFFIKQPRWLLLKNS